MRRRIILSRLIIRICRMIKLKGRKLLRNRRMRLKSQNCKYSSRISRLMIERGCQYMVNHSQICLLRREGVCNFRKDLLVYFLKNQLVKYDLMRVMMALSQSCMNELLLIQLKISKYQSRHIDIQEHNQVISLS